MLVDVTIHNNLKNIYQKVTYKLKTTKQKKTF